MTSDFTVIIKGQKVHRSAGYDAELDAVHHGPYSDSRVAGYCHDIVGYCDADDCKLHLSHAKFSRANSLLDHWGFSIWRTVFTPGSDLAFARALDTINQWVKHECFEQSNRAHVSTAIRQHDHDAACEVWKRYRNEIVENRDLDGASPETVRQRFMAWIESRGMEQNQTSRYRYCILIDKDVLETLSRLPLPPIEGRKEAWQLYSLKVIDVEIDGEDDDEYPHGYRSCIMTPPWMLAHIYFFCHNVEAEKMRDELEGIPVYVFADL